MGNTGPFKWCCNFPSMKHLNLQKLISWIAFHSCSLLIHKPSWRSLIELYLNILPVTQGGIYSHPICSAIPLQHITYSTSPKHKVSANSVWPSGMLLHAKRDPETDPMYGKLVLIWAAASHFCPVPGAPPQAGPLRLWFNAAPFRDFQGFPGLLQLLCMHHLLWAHSRWWQGICRIAKPG